MRIKIAISLLTAFILLGPALPLRAETPPTPAADAVKTDAPVEDVQKIDQQKLEVAKELSIWLNKTLQQKKALVAVIAREGGEETKKHDATGMGHAGLAVYDPRAQSWIIYNLLNNVQGKEPKGSIWRSGPVDFFYGQKGYTKNALLMIPDEITQERMYSAILDGRYKRLFFTDHYNLLSAPASDSSLNCNKWLLMNIAAARMDSYEPFAVLAQIEEGFAPGEIRLNVIERQFAKGKPTVRGSEVPAFGPIHTVTVESLYRSDLFGEKLYYADSH